MIQQQANALTFYGFFTASKAGATGLTVTADVYEATTAAPIVSAASATELAGGLYYYTLASGSVDADGAYIAVFKTADATVDQQHIPAVFHVGATWVDRIDATVSSRSAFDASTDTVTLADAGITAAKIDTGAVDADALAADAAVEIAAAVWDRVLTGATHNIASSAGRRLRAIPDTIGGSVDDATPSATEFATSLAGAYSDDHFNDQTIRFTSGAAAGEVAVIVDYVDLTGTITLDEAMANTPGNTDTFEILSTHVHPKSQIADAIWDEAIAGHAGAGSTGAALSSATAPSAATVADAVWDEATSGHSTTGTFGAKLLDLVDQSSVTVVTAVSGSAITLYSDTYWSFAVSGLGDTSGYETLLLTFKSTTSVVDTAAALYLRSDTGLIAIDGGAPVDAANGTLTNDGTGFTATVEMAETAGIARQENLTWWLKGIDTTPDPDTGTVIASGIANILPSGVKATS